MDRRRRLVDGRLEERGGRSRGAPPHALVPSTDARLVPSRFPRRRGPPSIAAMEAAEGDSLAAWAATAEAVGATTRRLEKGAILARYLAALDAGAVAVAARFFAGTVFARHDARTTRVGPALLT